MNSSDFDYGVSTQYLVQKLIAEGTNPAIIRLVFRNNASGAPTKILAMTTDTVADDEVWAMALVYDGSGYLTVSGLGRETVVAGDITLRDAVSFS